jgi:hypothetical protein
MSTFWRIIEIVATMGAGHVLFGLWEDWLKKRKLLGHKER